MLYLLGQSPVSVAAQGHSYLQGGIEDVAYMTMRFPNDVLTHAAQLA
ncbi:MAG: hypothetical protein R2838_24225 [Caldilineaceae bacterium]